MKRSKGLERRTALKADPEKTREFVQRGRGTLGRSKIPKREPTYRCTGCGAEALLHVSECPVCGGHMKRKAPAAKKAAKKRRVEFQARRAARTMVCRKPGCERRAKSWHHWLPQEAIRTYVRGLRLPEDEERRLLRRLLRDERNLSPYCHDHHGAHGTMAHEFRWDEVPESARAFACELGPESIARLHRMYWRPMRPRPQDAA